MPDPSKTLPVELTFAEANFIFQSYEAAQIPGPEFKRLAASIQEKLSALDYTEPEPSEPTEAVVQ